MGRNLEDSVANFALIPRESPGGSSSGWEAGMAPTILFLRRFHLFPRHFHYHFHYEISARLNCLRERETPDGLCLKLKNNNYNKIIKKRPY